MLGRAAVLYTGGSWTAEVVVAAVAVCLIGPCAGVSVAAAAVYPAGSCAGVAVAAVTVCLAGSCAEVVVAAGVVTRCTGEPATVSPVAGIGVEDEATVEVVELLLVELLVIELLVVKLVVDGGGTAEGKAVASSRAPGLVELSPPGALWTAVLVSGE